MTRTWTPRPGSCGTWPGRGPGRASPDQEGQLRLGRRVGRPTPGRLGREHDPRRCPDRVQRLRRHAHGLGPDPIRGREQRRASVPAAQPGTHPPGPDTRDVTGPVGGAPMMRFMARPGRRRQVQRPVHIGVGDRTGTPTRPARQAPDQKKPVTVHDNVPAGPDGASTRRAYNPVESDAARSKADALQARFADWLWQDPVRADRLVDDYNRRFNSTVLRDYGTAGQALTLPGLAKNFTPPPAPTRRRRTNHRGTLRRTVPRGRRRENRRNGHGLHGTAPPRPGDGSPHAERTGPDLTL